MRLIIFFLCLFVIAPTFAEEKIGIYVLGDSWASLPCKFDSFIETLKELKINRYAALHHKRNQVRILGCADSTKIGAQTKDWLEEKNWKVVEKKLKSNPIIKIVYLSIGGNDFLNHWKKSLSPKEEQLVFEEMRAKIKKMIDGILFIRPDVRILVSQYDYPNFVTYTHIPTNTEIFKRMQSPTPAELNSGILRFFDVLAELSITNKIEFIHHYGLMTYYYGNPRYKISPKTTLAPFDISPRENPSQYGGRVDVQTHPKAMAHLWPIYRDAFHLTPTGYKYVIRHSFQNVLVDWLADFGVKPI